MGHEGYFPTRRPMNLPRPARMAVQFWSTFKFGTDRILGRGHVPANVEHVRLAADLAVFDILLATTRGFIHGGLVPFPAPSALEACFLWHVSILRLFRDLGGARRKISSDPRRSVSRVAGSAPARHPLHDAHVWSAAGAAKSASGSRSSAPSVKSLPRPAHHAQLPGGKC